VTIDESIGKWRTLAQEKRERREAFLFPLDECAPEAAGRRANVPHPIPYQGSKRNLALAILAHFPADVDRLIEPFAGSAALCLAAAYYQRACRFWINDAHVPLVSLWREIIDRPQELATMYADLWEGQRGRERLYYDKVREQFNATHRPDCFLYLLARCVKAAIRYNSDGEFNNSPDNRRLGARPETMLSRITGASALLCGRTELSHLDYTEVVSRCDPADLIYMDPPYQGVCGSRDHRYAPKVSHDAFCDVLADLNKRGFRYLVSYDGRSGTKTYGQPMPATLRLTHIELHAGRSTQATLLGQSSETYESIYLSPALAKQLAFGKRGSMG
jgi:DNA adenine methylase